MDYKKLLVAAACVVSLLFISAIAIRSCKKCEVVEKTIVKVKSDTIYIETNDTITIEHWWQEPAKIDTFIVFEENHDTLYITGIARDTIWIDSLQLNLVGNYPVIHDSVFIETTIREKECFSIDVGACAYPSIKGMKSSDIGVKIGFNFKGGNSIEAGYNFFGQQMVIGYRKRINFRKNNHKVLKD